MGIRKAVITSAGPDQRRLPLQRFVDLDGTEKTALQIVVEEVVAAGIQEICLVIHPGDGPAYLEAAGQYARLLTLIEQPAPRGYGEALHRAAAFTGGELVRPPGQRSSLSQPSTSPLRPAIGRGGRGRTVRRLGRAAHAGKHAAILRSGGRLARARTRRALQDRSPPGKAHAHQGRAGVDRAGAPCRALPLPVWDARPDAGGDGTAGRTRQQRRSP